MKLTNLYRPFNGGQFDEPGCLGPFKWYWAKGQVVLGLHLFEHPAPAAEHSARLALAEQRLRAVAEILASLEATSDLVSMRLLAKAAQDAIGEYFNGNKNSQFTRDRRSPRH